MIFRLICFLSAASLSVAVEYTIPSDRLPATGTWQAAGVPGGIPDRTTIHSTQTATGSDQVTALQAALNACTSGQVVKLAAGTFRINTSLNIPSNVTLRGTLDASGNPLTIVDARAEQGVIVGNYSANLNSPTGGADLVVASLTKGATTIQVDDASSFASGHMAIIRAEGDDTIPLVNNYGGDRNRGQVVMVSSINTAATPDTITIAAPGLHGDLTGSESAIIIGGEGTHRTGCGLEDLRVTGANGGGVLKVAVDLTGCNNSWIRNVTADGTINYAMAVAFGYPGVYQSEIRDCRMTGAGAVANSVSGIFVGASASLLIIDNIFEEWSFALLQQGAASGNVFAGNFWINTGTGITTTNGNHDPAPQFTLYENNVGANWQSDGLNGGSLYDMHFRNWWMGEALGETGDSSGIVANRYTRFLSAIGNQYGKTGVGAAPPSGFGNPNMGNGSSSNAVSRRATASTLTTRTTATSGTITAPASHGVTTGATIDLVWSIYSAPYNIAKIRRDVTVGTVSGTSIPFSGGEGDDLPAAAEIVYVPTTNSALWDNDPDFDTTLGRERTWTGTLTTRTNDTSGVFTVTGGMTEFNAALTDAYFSQRGFRPFPGHDGSRNNCQLRVTSVTGNAVSFDDADGIIGFWTSLPPEGSALTMVPSNFGFQGLDLDVLLTSLQKGNYHGKATGSGIPAVESLGSDTLPESLFRTGTPANYTTLGLTYPPVNPSSPTDDSYEIIPAGYRYVNGGTPPPPSSTAVTVSGNASVGGTLSIGN